MSVSVLRHQHLPMAPLSATPRVLGSLVFNMEVDCNADSRIPAQHGDATMQNIHAAVERLALYTRPMSGFPSKLLRDVKRLKTQLLQDDEKVDAVLLAAMLSERGYSVLVRCALGGAAAAGAPGSCFRNLRHEFVFVRCESGDYEGVELLVDPNFREQFAIPQPTPSFAAILASVPEVFVGTSVRLLPVVELICTEMASSFRERGLTIPPWRAPSAMMSKWLPAKVKDISVDPSAAEGGSPREVSPRPGMATATGLFPAKQITQVAQRPPFGVFSQDALSPEQRLREAAQQLEALALHSQQHASPTHTPSTVDGLHHILASQLPHVPPRHAAPAAPAAETKQQQLQEEIPTVTLGPIALQARQPQLAAVQEDRTAAHDSEKTDFKLQRHSDLVRPAVPRTKSGTLSPSLAMLSEMAGGDIADHSSVTINMFGRISEPLSLLQSRAGRLAPPVSLLSVQLAGGHPASPTASFSRMSQPAMHVQQQSSGGMTDNTRSASSVSAVHNPAVVWARMPTARQAGASPAVGDEQQLQEHNPQHVGASSELHPTFKPSQWVGPVIHTVKLAFPPDTSSFTRGVPPSSPSAVCSPH